MKNCPACGAPNPDEALFCNTCGARLDAAPGQNADGQNPGNAQGPNPGQNPNYGQNSNYGQNPNYESGSGYGNSGPRYAQGPAYGGPQGYGGLIQPRSIALAIILSIITCGIYTFYWMYKINDELNQLAGNYQATSGGMVVIFDIITCHIYGIYWAYKMGQNCSRLNGDSSSGILYLLLALFGFQIINLALFQDMINKCA